MNRVYIKTYGCQMNERDSEAVAAMLRGRGYVIVDEEAQADIILLNTCSVRDQAEQKAIGKAGHLMRRKRTNPNFKIGIIGCMAQNRGEDLLDTLPDLDLVVGTQKFHQVPDHLDNIIETIKAQGPKPATIVDIEEEAGSQNTIKDHVPGATKVSAFVSIMQGCNMQCAFCIVPTTRGKERARPIESIVEEVEALVENGTKEVTLLGQIVNSYGRREIPFKDGKSPFVQLLERLHAIEGLERIRFTSPHPRGFKQDLVNAFGYLPKLGKYIHMPLQSGSNGMLKAMNRPYTQERFRELVADLRAVVPDMWISTDIIVGFPGETEEDFMQTYDFFEEIGFDMGFIFKYSVRPGTAAEPLGDPITKEAKEARNQALLRLVADISLKRNSELVGTTQELLVEAKGRRGENIYMGRTLGYRKVLFEGSDEHIGQLVTVRIEEASASTIKGVLVEAAQASESEAAA